MVFAAAPSQSDFLECLCLHKEIDFSRIHAFHMDEYIGLPPDAPQRFGNFLETHIFKKANFGAISYIDGGAEPLAECARYAALLREAPIDIVCMGVGENAHIAFNDPDTADFHDAQLVKVVDLDSMSRQQQVNDQCFPSLDLVPKSAITLTIPALMGARHQFCIVPARSKAQAVAAMLSGPVGEVCPASVLRDAESAVLYLDQESASMLPEKSEPN